MRIRVLCDFDGTISREDVTDSILENHASPGWLSLETAWKAGEISGRICMKRQIALVSARWEDLDRTIAGVGIDPDFPAFTEFMRCRGFDLRIASSGLDRAIDLLIGHDSGIQISACRLVPIGDEQYRLEFPHAREDCVSDAPTCKCALADDGRDAITILIGDGASDFCVAARADFVLAKSALLTHCRENNIPHAGVSSFADVIDWFKAQSAEDLASLTYGLAEI